MKSNVKMIIIIGLIVFVSITSICVIGLYRHKFVNSKKSTNIYTISIHNKTNKEVMGLQIAYKNSVESIVVPNILPKSSCKIDVDTLKSELGENLMWIVYKDKNGKFYQEVVVGYFEKGIGGRQSISITSIDDEGKMTFQK
ncbi:MAG: hypothetical protein N2645_16035 [Clostridia bacterium]|nr:hypothetical protein [Clostridia bacterium]